MQDKNMRDKITKIGKREMQTRFILVRPLPVPMSILKQPDRGRTRIKYTLKMQYLGSDYRSSPNEQWSTKRS